MEIQSLNQIVSNLVPLDLATTPTPKKFHAAFCELGKLDRGFASVGIWHGQTPWEYHSKGDEFLMVLQGAVTLTLLLDDGAKAYPLNQGDVFIVPARIWHRSFAEQPVTLLSVLASAHGPVSYAENPKTDKQLISEEEILGVVAT